MTGALSSIGGSYLLVGSMGGQRKYPVWVYDLRAYPDVEIRDGTEMFKMGAHPPRAEMAPATEDG